VGVATVVALAAIAVVWSDHPITGVGSGVFAVVLARLSQIDLEQRRLPNRIVGPLAGATVVWVAVAGVSDGDSGRVVRAGVIGLGVAAFFLALSFVGNVGMGDVKLAFPVGLVAGWLGAGAPQTMLLVTAFSAAAVAGVLLATGRGRTTIPFGPFLAVGSIAGIVVAGRA
jgi:leader peptidase (prepilin peptidase) / N-methyltransferase